MLKRGSVLENLTHEINIDFEMQTGHQISVRRSDIVLIKNKKRTSQLVDLGYLTKYTFRFNHIFCWERNVFVSFLKSLIRSKAVTYSSFFISRSLHNPSSFILRYMITLTCDSLTDIWTSVYPHPTLTPTLCDENKLWVSAILLTVYLITILIINFIFMARKYRKRCRSKVNNKPFENHWKC